MGFEYVEPSSVEEAVEVLRESGPETFVVAGGTDLVLRMRLRLAEPRKLVGLRRLAELRVIQEEADGALSVGAAATLSDMARSDTVRRRAPLLAEVCGLTRSNQVRSLATLGGTLGAASPQAEPPIALLALAAEVEVQGPSGTRRLGVDDLIVGFGKTSLGEAEIVTRVIIRPTPEGTRTAYERLARRGSIEPPLVAGAVALALDAKGVCRSARVVLGVATDRPIRLAEAERMLVGRRPDADLLREAAGSASRVEVRAGVRASRAYRSRVAPVVVARALARAVGEREGW